MNRWLVAFACGLLAIAAIVGFTILRGGLRLSDSRQHGTNGVQPFTATDLPERTGTDPNDSGGRAREWPGDLSPAAGGAAPSQRGRDVETPRALGARRDSDGDDTRSARARAEEERRRRALEEEPRLEHQSRRIAGARDTAEVQTERVRAGQHASPADTVSVERYPSVEAPEEVAAGREFAVQVSLTESAVTSGVKILGGKTTPRGALALPLPGDRDAWRIDVVLTGDGFVFREGANTAALKLPREGDSTPALFQVRARPGGPRDVRTLYATFWHEGLYLAKAARPVTVVSALEEARAAAPMTAMSGRAVPLEAGSRAPDLTLWVLESTEPGRDAQIVIASPHLQVSSHVVPVSRDLPAWLDTQYARFTTLAGRAQESPAGREQARAALRGFGRELYARQAPEAFKSAFWRLRDRLGDRFQTIQFYSNSPLVPWELMRPSRANGEEELDFLGIEYRVARWHVGQAPAGLERAPQRVPMKELVVIAPEYRKGDALPAQTEELRALQGVKGYRRLPGRLSDVQGVLRAFPEGIIHFAGHAVVKPGVQGVFAYSIRLEDSDVDLLAFRGMTAPVVRHHPFMFFNACSVGQAHRVANFVNGWAPAALEAGASGYVAGLWPLVDGPAAEFAAQFYRALDEGLARGPVVVAELLRDARRRFHDTGQPTFLAYVYYGDPNLRLVRRD